MHHDFKYTPCPGVANGGEPGERARSRSAGHRRRGRRAPAARRRGGRFPGPPPPWLLVLLGIRLAAVAAWSVHRVRFRAETETA